ncbi:MAG: hypothetical protein RLZZ31_598 [Actinomycetota bacterium]|jgi:homoserine O-acetyltransferase
MTETNRRAPLSADPLPASGAWRSGDPVGDRKFVDVAPGRSFSLEGGGRLVGAQIAYETWGQLNDEKTNAILVCHALTGDSHAAGDLGHGHPTPGWWDELIGPKKAIDTDRYFVVCSNVLGGCQGSTGPASIDPQTQKPYGANFPVVTIRDMVRAQNALAESLGIEKWHSVIGGSMGGMQVLEWAVMYPDRVRSIIPIATCAAASAFQIAQSAVQRSAIVFDPNWRNGDYYDAPAGQGPTNGLAVARGAAQISYRSDAAYTRKFGRSEHDQMDNGFTLWQRFGVENYLDYQGAKLARRFDANTYLVINRAMDLHDIGRGRGGVARALARVKAPVLGMTITSDTLYPTVQQVELHEGIVAAGGSSRLNVIHSDEGHDAFLIDFDQVAAYITPFLHEIENAHG